MTGLTIHSLLFFLNNISYFAVWSKEESSVTVLNTQNLTYVNIVIKNNYHIKNLKYAKVISSLKFIINTLVSMKTCELAKKLVRFKGKVIKIGFMLHLLLHNYFKGHLACCQSLFI